MKFVPQKVLRGQNFSQTSPRKAISRLHQKNALIGNSARVASTLTEISLTSEKMNIISKNKKYDKNKISILTQKYQNEMKNFNIQRRSEHQNEKLNYKLLTDDHNLKNNKEKERKITKIITNYQ